jgi:hypothetical protein
MGRFEDVDNPGSMTVGWSVIGAEMGWKPSRCRRVLSRISSVSKLSVDEKPDGNVTFLIPKWLELQSSWGGKREARFEQDAGRSKKLEVRSKRLEVRGEKLAKSVPPPLVEIWNQNRGSLPEARGCSSGRARHVAARWQENSDPAYWAKVIRILASSPFCRGQNPRGWRADFDFLIMPDTHLKALEGKYDDRTPLSPADEKRRRAQEVEKMLAEERAQMQKDHPEVDLWNP